MKRQIYIQPTIDVLNINTEGMIADSDRLTVNQTGEIDETNSDGTINSKEGSYNLWDE